MDKVIDIVLDALLDSAKLLPFLFLTYLFMEFLEHKASDRVRGAVTRSGRVGPLIGASFGLLPQCGFSAALAGLYAGRVVTLGTLFAVFLSTSDEMLPVFLGEQVPVRVIAIILAIKFSVALLVGFCVDLIFRKKQTEQPVVDLCEQEHCHCEKGILRSALHHTLHIALFILIINLVLGGVLAFVGDEKLSAVFSGLPVLSQCLAAIIGLIPNCAASVTVATLYARGLLSAGSMIAGLLGGAGAGVLVLFRNNRRIGENLLILLGLFVVSVLCGCLFDYTGLAVWLGI